MGNRTDAVTGNGKTDEIRRDIERTQQEMSRTIEEIQQRLSPRYMMQKTKDSMREAGVNASRNFIDKVRENPIPIAMVGVGLLLLMRDSSSDKGGYDVEFIPERTGWDATENRYSSVADYRDVDDDAGGNVRGRVSEAKEKISDVADTARERISGVASTAREATTSAIGSAGDAARRISAQARSRMSRARYQSRDLLQESPLIVGVAALAAGAILGALIPETNKEHQLLGETRDRLAGRAMDMAREGMSRAREVATVAAGAATEAAKSEIRSQTQSQKTDVGKNVGIGLPNS